MTSARVRRPVAEAAGARLADEGLYLASESTMYRLQHRRPACARRRAERRTHVTRATTVHRATGPNQVWSWDITWLPTMVRGRYLYLYLVMDVWSRRIVGWDVARREAADLAATLIQRICAESDVDPQGLVLHSDNGKPMRGSTMIATLAVARRRAVLQPTARLQRQPVLRGAVSHAQAHAGLPALPFADVEQRRAGWLASSPGTTASIATARSATSRPTSVTLAASMPSSPDAKRSTQRARTKHPERWSRGTRNWTPVGTVILEPRASGPTGGMIIHRDNCLETHRVPSL